jgi:Ca-activated chloride channel family protein
MNLPQIELIPLRPAVCFDAPLTLDVLVRILPGVPGRPVQRPAINLGLVLDRSGSMAQGNKIQFAREAAICAVGQLLPTDRVSVTIFDEVVEAIVPNTPATDKAAVVHLLQDIQPRGSTALHAAWVEGARQVSRGRIPGGLNRVLLLSDGLANVGQTEPAAIAADVQAWARRGVSTTTMGVGRDYNEDLLQAMAAGGDGNYYYIESPGQLLDIFQTELQGLMATVGHKVSLGVEPQNGVTVAEVLNDLDRTEFGRLKLSNLIAGMPVEVLVRLNVPPLRPTAESSKFRRLDDGTFAPRVLSLGRVAEVCKFRLAWDAPGSRERQTLSAALALPSVPVQDWNALAPNAEVHERVALLRVARLKLQATRHLESGDREAAGRCVREAKDLLGTLAPSALTEQEAQAIAALEASLASDDRTLFTKQAKYQHYERTHTRPIT